MKAIDYPCATCSAPAGEKCQHTTDDGFLAKLPYYHAERVDAALCDLADAATSADAVIATVVDELRRRLDRLEKA